jgi:hypothetical protein
MKKIVMLINTIILFTSAVKGQTYDSDSSQTTIEQSVWYRNSIIFGLLDTTKISTNVLFEKSVLQDSLILFTNNGNNLYSNNCDLQLASNSLRLLTLFNKQIYKFNKIDVLFDRLKVEHDSLSDYQLFVANFDFQTIKPTAFTNGYLQLSSTSIIENGNPITDNLYQKHKYFIATSNNIYINKASFQICLSDSNIFTNTTDSIVSYMIDRGNGLEPFWVNSCMPFSFSTSDSLDITFIAITNTNDTLFSVFSIYVELPIVANTTPNNFRTAIADGCAFAYGVYTPYDTDVSWINESTTDFWNPNIDIYKRNKYEEHYNTKIESAIFTKLSCHNTTGKIRKPFILVDGTSFVSETPEIARYSLETYLQQKRKRNGESKATISSNSILTSALSNNNAFKGDDVGYATINWATLSMGIDAEGLDVNDPLRIEKSPQLFKTLCEAGYDVIFYDFGSGQTYIENNASGLYKALTKIKQNMTDGGSTEKMVVCGASMGGLVSRYAIDKLEQDGHTDWISHFISFDSPQMGANIPLSLQHFLQHMKLVPDIKVSYEKVTSPGASQLVRYSSLATHDNEPHSNWERDYLKAGFNSFHLPSDPQRGWPHYCKLVSITNGSRVGALQDNYDDFLLTSGGGSSTYLTPGAMSMDIDGLLDVDMYALPNYNTNKTKILDVTIANNWYLLTPLVTVWLLPVAGLALVNKKIKLRNCLPLDSQTGSFRWSLRDAYEQLDDLGFFEYHSGNNTPKYFKHGFIPIESALGLKNFENILQTNLNTATTLFQNTNGRFKDPTHVHSFFDVSYAPTTNQGHVEITDENIGWVMQVLNDCDDEVIKFQNEVIPSGTYTACDAIYAGNDVGKFANCAQNVRALLNTTTSVIPCMDTPPTSTSNDIVTATSSYFTQNYLEDPNNPNDDYIEMCVYTISHYGYNTVSNCGPAKVQNGSNVTFKASNLIDLQPGFEVEAGATFDATILGGTTIACASTGRYATNNSSVQPTTSITNISQTKGTKLDNVNYEIPDNSIKNTLGFNDFKLIPNPANGITNLFYSLEKSSNVTIEISTIYGQQISKNSSDTEQVKGEHNAELDISKLSKGIYIVTLKSLNGNKSKQLIIN